MRKYINDTDKTAKPTTEIIYGIDYVVGYSIESNIQCRT